MSFNIDANPVFSETVNVTAPGGAKSDFKATFNALDDDAASAFDMSTLEGGPAFLRAVLVSVDEIVDDEGAAVPSSDAVLDALVRKPWVRVGLVQAYYAGLTKAAQGN